MVTDKQLSESKENDLEQIIWSRVKKLDKRIRIVLFSSLIWGIFAHGMVMFNKYSFHDDARHLFNVGFTYESGRWMLGLLGDMNHLLFGGNNYSLPLFNGIISILCIAASAYLIIHLLNIRHVLLCISITGILISFPVITGIFGYMFTAPYYMISILFAVAGVWLVNKKISILYFLTGALLMACSSGIYQAFIPVMLSLALLCFIRRLTADTSDTPKKLILSGVYLAGAVVSGVLLYFLINKCFLTYYGIELLDYKGISNMGKESPVTYLSRVRFAVKHFLLAKKLNSYSSMFPFRLKHLFFLTLLLVGGLFLIMLIRTFKKNISRGILLFLSILLLPITYNFIFIMCDPKYMHPIMTYGQSMLFVTLVWLLEVTNLPKIRLSRTVYGFGTALLLFISVSYCRLANIHYMKADFIQQRLISYYTVLITQIKSTPGYGDELPVVYINPRNIQDTALSSITEFDEFRLAPYKFTYSSVNNYAWLEFMNNWCAFSPELADEEIFKNLPEVTEMPYYPDDGSIKIINDTVVVKFGPAEE